LKVGSIGPFANWVPTIQEKHEDAGNAGGGNSSSGQQNPEKKETPPEQLTQTHEPTEKEVIEAIEKFQHDAVQTSGLKAETVGAGPGLRVVLKDINGSVVRQFSGGEFVRLRDSSAQDGRKRGRLLDKKY
jgi:hypothetical protein